MRIHYLSAHSVLEWQEAKLFTEMGHDVFCNGAYTNPKGHSTLHRPGIEGMKYYPEYERLSSQYPKNNLPTELIEPFDVLIFMGGILDTALVDNWQRIKHKKVIWRTIGQSRSSNERMLKPLRDEGLKIVRYSPKEKNIPNYIGKDVMIRFYNDHNDLGLWEGNEKRVINVSQTLKGRGKFCHYKEILELMSGFDAKVFGNGNEDLGNLNGGSPSYELLKGHLRDSGVFVYGGTYPASYTLGFIEAWMTGIPVVSIGKETAMIGGEERFDFFEIPELITNGESGFCSDDIGELKSYIKQLLENDSLAHKISSTARKKAQEIFGKNKIFGEWKSFLAKL